MSNDVAERLAYATPPVARPLGWQWVAPPAMNIVSAGLGLLLAIGVRPLAARRLDHAVLALMMPGGLVVLLQVVLLAVSLVITLDRRQPAWHPIVRRAVLWTSPVGLILPLIGLLLGALLQ